MAEFVRKFSGTGTVMKSGCKRSCCAKGSRASRSRPTGASAPKHSMQPKRAVDCFEALFRSRITEGNTIMATGESIAHLNCLRARGLVERYFDSDGIAWYQRA